MQGKELFSGTGAALASGRDAVLVEENQQRAYLGFEQPVRVRTIVTATHRMSVFVEGGWGELYDLATDPHETSNLWNDGAAVEIKAGLMFRLAQLLTEQSDTSPNPTRIA